MLGVASIWVPSIAPRAPSKNGKNLGLLVIQSGRGVLDVGCFRYSLMNAGDRIWSVTFSMTLLHGKVA
jgi:hypothetical protein